MIGRIDAIADTHSNPWALYDVLRALGYRGKDGQLVTPDELSKVVLLGDNAGIDRWPYMVECSKLILGFREALKQQRVELATLVGNHEIYLLSALTGLIGSDEPGLEHLRLPRPLQHEGMKGLASLGLLELAALFEVDVDQRGSGAELLEKAKLYKRRSCRGRLLTDEEKANLAGLLDKSIQSFHVQQIEGSEETRRQHLLRLLDTGNGAVLAQHLKQLKVAELLEGGILMTHTPPSKGYLEALLECHAKASPGQTGVDHMNAHFRAWTQALLNPSPQQKTVWPEGSEGIRRETLSWLPRVLDVNNRWGGAEDPSLKPLLGQLRDEMGVWAIVCGHSGIPRKVSIVEGDVMIISADSSYGKSKGGTQSSWVLPALTLRGETNGVHVDYGYGAEKQGPQLTTVLSPSPHEQAAK